MATTFSADASVDYRSRITNEGALNTITEDLVTGAGGLTEFEFSLSDGTGNNQAQLQWYDSRTLTAGASETLDLRALTGRHSDTITFAEVKWLIIRIQSPGTGVSLTIGGAASDEWSAAMGAAGDKYKVQTFDMKVGCEGWTVDATHKNLKIENPGSGSVTYDIIILGN